MLRVVTVRLGLSRHRLALSHSLPRLVPPWHAVRRAPVTALPPRDGAPLPPSIVPVQLPGRQCALQGLQSLRFVAAPVDPALHSFHPAEKSVDVLYGQFAGQLVSRGP